MGRVIRLARMLEVTTELFLHTEVALFFSDLLARKTSLLDVGCGNGAYIAGLVGLYSQLDATGIEIDSGMYSEALSRQQERIQFMRGSYENWGGQPPADIILARLVVLHLLDRMAFVRWASEHVSPGGHVIVIDYDDSRFQENEALPLFMDLYRQTRRRINRERTFLTLPDTLRIEFAAAGMSLERTERYSLRADRPELKQKFAEYMKLATEYMLDAPIGSDRERELALWLDKPEAQVEIPMFGCRFADKGGRLSGMGNKL